MRGYTMNRTEYLNRLRRIEGQVRGLQRMIDNDEYCIDILTQVSAVTAALQGVAIGLVDEHLRHCVMDAARDTGDGDGNAALTDAVRAVERLVRS